jgi:hypothetical protein
MIPDGVTLLVMYHFCTDTCIRRTVLIIYTRYVPLTGLDCLGGTKKVDVTGACQDIGLLQASVEPRLAKGV